MSRRRKSQMGKPTIKQSKLFKLFDTLYNHEIGADLRHYLGCLQDELTDLCLSKEAKLIRLILEEKKVLLIHDPRGVSVHIEWDIWTSLPVNPPPSQKAGAKYDNRWGIYIPKGMDVMAPDISPADNYAKFWVTIWGRFTDEDRVVRCSRSTASECFLALAPFVEE